MGRHAVASASIFSAETKLSRHDVRSFVWSIGRVYTHRESPENRQSRKINKNLIADTKPRASVIGTFLGPADRQLPAERAVAAAKAALVVDDVPAIGGLLEIATRAGCVRWSRGSPIKCQHHPPTATTCGSSCYLHKSPYSAVGRVSDDRAFACRQLCRVSAPTQSAAAFGSDADAFNASRTAFAGEKVNFLEAGISIVSPVAGFRPKRAARSAALNRPKPVRFTSSPAAVALVMAATTPSMIFRV
jgi:hypothetical protein